VIDVSRAMQPIVLARQHVKTLWPGAGWLLPLGLSAWAAERLASGPIRVELVALFFCALGLGFWNERTKSAFTALFPLSLLGVAYDSMRWVKDLGVTPARVHACDLRALEARFFGSGGATVHDWLLRHPNAALDRLCAIPYGTFLFTTIAFAVFLYLRAPREAVQRFGWTFFTMNILGFVTYHLYPAAPPWYVHAHGCAIDLGARASEGPALARVDAWMGVPYFAGFYGRSNDVFGAVPSLHVAYPELILMAGWRFLRTPGRMLAIANFIVMCFAAVYLDHHWIIDVVLGLVYGAASYGLVAFVTSSRPPAGGGSLASAKV
jgi:hypothetical protein